MPLNAFQRFTAPSHSFNPVLWESLIEAKPVDDNCIPGTAVGSVDPATICKNLDESPKSNIPIQNMIIPSIDHTWSHTLDLYDKEREDVFLNHVWLLLSSVKCW